MAGGVGVPVGDGEIDWTAILTRLHDLGYDGTLTLEPHLEQDREGVARSIDALQRLVADTGA